MQLNGCKYFYGKGKFCLRNITVMVKCRKYRI